jgi:two-component system, OmpR family, response regulator
MRSLALCQLALCSAAGCWELTHTVFTESSHAEAIWVGLNGEVQPTQDNPRVLVVDDEENIRFLLESALPLFGFTVQAAETGRSGMDAISSFRPDLVILDVMLPDLDGFEVVRRLRGDGVRTPVLFLTAKDTTSDFVRGLTLGGDDYVAKPFSLEELVARIKALLRRAGHGEMATLRCDDLELDDAAHRVTRGGSDIDLSPTEYKLLRYLLANTGRVVSRSQILDHVWAYDFGGDSNVVDIYISYLRRKVDDQRTPLIKTIRGVGYTLRADR